MGLRLRVLALSFHPSFAEGWRLFQTMQESFIMSLLLHCLGVSVLSKDCTDTSSHMWFSINIWVCWSFSNVLKSRKNLDTNSWKPCTSQLLLFFLLMLMEVVALPWMFERSLFWWYYDIFSERRVKNDEKSDFLVLLWNGKCLYQPYVGFFPVMCTVYNLCTRIYVHPMCLRLS